MGRGVWLAAVAASSLFSCGDGREAPPELEVDLPSRNRGAADAGTDVTTIPLPPPLPPSGPECDPTKPFGAPTLLPGFDPAAGFATPRLSADELTIYFTMGSAADRELGFATRPTRSADFANPTALGALGSPSNDNDPSVTGDHLAIFFHSARSGDAQLYTATRATTSAAWGPPALVPNVNGPSADAHAYPRANELWFTSLRGGTTWNIYLAPKTPSGYGLPSPVAALNSPNDDWQPQPSEDGLRVLFASNRPNGAGLYDLWVATRASTSQAFGQPRPISEVNSAFQDFAGWMSADGCRLYFSSNRASPGNASQQLFFAKRPK